MFPEWRIMYKAFLIKYGEIGVKGKNRYLFEDALVRQIRYALKKTDVSMQRLSAILILMKP